MATNLPGKVVGDDALGLRLEHKTIAESGDAIIVLDQLSTLETQPLSRHVVKWLQKFNYYSQSRCLFLELAGPVKGHDVTHALKEDKGSDGVAEDPELHTRGGLTLGHGVGQAGVHEACKPVGNDVQL